MRFPHVIAILLALAIPAGAQPIGHVSPTNLNFGSVLIGSTSPQKEVALKNTGNAKLIISSISITGPFAIAVNKCSGGLNVGTHCNVWATYTPQAAETDSGTLTFIDNASNSPQTVSLAGTGVTLETLYQFHAQKNGIFPHGGLVLDARSNLYGITSAGGSSTNCYHGEVPARPYNGCGTVFKLAPNGKETVLHSFGGRPTDGASPAGLASDAQGNFIGTSSEGGSSFNCGDEYACGTVFTLTSGTEAVLYSFCSQMNCADGAYPNGFFVFDAQGNIYGTTVYGGSTNCYNSYLYGCGTVFKLTPSGTETILYSFCSQANCIDGYYPSGPLVFDSQGNLYGTTSNGGSSANCQYGYNACGTVFKLTPSGTETVLYSFAGYPNDGESPNGLVLDAQGNLFGTTSGGGTSSNCGAFTCGTVFKLTPNGTETVLYSFTGYPNDGESPNGLILDAQGNLFGTTLDGGSSPNCGAYGCGTVFKLTPDGNETVLHSFVNSDGAGPSGLMSDVQGTLYGTTVVSSGCRNGCGTIFKLLP